MFSGTVKFHATIRGNGLTFPLVDFDPKKPGVDRIEMEATTGDDIQSTVYFSSVATEDEGRAIAAQVNAAALNRISFFHTIVIENARITSTDFSRLNPEPNHLYAGAGHFSLTGYPVRLVTGLTAAGLRNELEQSTSPGERNFGLFRSARQSASPVEEFMHLYHILLMLFDDHQVNVDAFINQEEPAVPQTPHPLKQDVMETMYTRLRNEFAHQRSGVNLETTKTEMASKLGELIAITKRAIELRS